MRRVSLILLSVLFACFIAGTFGAVHNQISYTVAPSYFHDLKFNQFAIDPSLHNRLGASLVGWYGSWWMGLLLCAPLNIVGLFIRGDRDFARAFILSGMLVVVIALLSGLSGLAWSFNSVDYDSLPLWLAISEIEDPVAFARAGAMHLWSYLGSVLGLIASMGMMIMIARKPRKA